MATVTGPKVYLIDIETSPNLGWTWGKWETDIIRYKREWELLSFAWKKLGERSVRCASRPDYRDKTDASIVRQAWKILDDADIVIGHNVDKFDSKRLRAKFVEHNLPPTKPYKTIDTRKIARSQFSFNSNALDDLARTLKIGSKMRTGGVDLWFDCMAGDASAWRRMVAYNKHDVVLLEKVYERMKAWYPSHPNFALYSPGCNDPPGCPVCESEDVQRRGMQILMLSRRARFQCQSCGKWFSQAVRGA